MGITYTTEGDISLDRACRAFQWTSHTPDRRGQQVLDGYSARLAELAAFIGDKEGGQAVFDQLKARYLKKTLVWLDAHSRTASAMITGPAKFPVERNRKACEAEYKRLTELCYYSDRMEKIAERTLNPRVNNDAEYLAALKHRLETVKEGHYFKRLIREKIARIENRARIAAKGDTEVNGVKVVRNAEAQRLQLIFPGKPDDATRDKLKRRGFKWSPRFGAWQRQLTDNAELAASIILKELAA